MVLKKSQGCFQSLKVSLFGQAEISKSCYTYWTETFFATLIIAIVAKECCKDFEKLGKCCNVFVARILMLSKMLQGSFCKDSENFCNIWIWKVAKKNLCPEGRFRANEQRLIHLNIMKEMQQIRHLVRFWYSKRSSTETGTD